LFAIGSNLNCSPDAGFFPRRDITDFSRQQSECPTLYSLLKECAEYRADCQDFYSGKAWNDNAPALFRTCGYVRFHDRFFLKISLLI